MSLLPERLLKTLDVNRMPMFRSDHLREIERKAVRVVEFEGVFTGDDRLMPQLLHPREATLDRLEKPLLFRARHALDVRLRRDELGIALAPRGAPADRHGVPRGGGCAATRNRDLRWTDRRRRPEGRCRRARGRPARGRA